MGLQLCLPVWYTGPMRAAPSWGCNEMKGGPVRGPELHLAGGEDPVGFSPPSPAHRGMYLCPLSPSLSFLHPTLGVFHIRKAGVGRSREGWSVGFWFLFLFFKLSLCPGWGSDSGPQDQESHVPPTEPARSHFVVVVVAALFCF